ncbi:MAG: TRAP transporter permease, partial [Bacillota bacterium]
VAMCQRAIVLMLSLFIIFLTCPLNKKKGAKITFFDVLLALAGLAAGTYVLLYFDELVNRMGMPNTTDLIMGGIAILLVLEGTRRSLGWPLPVVTGLFLLYNYFGQYIPGTFGHRGYDPTRIINQMYLTTEGIFGVPLGVIVSIVYLFVLFGAFLEKSGGGNFFINFAVALAGRARGGPAKIAVIGSGLMGTISGSSIANAMTVGSFTIPLMKRIGYRPEFAAAVEAGASTGGQIMPPVMGAGAFIMSEFTQIPYLKIIAAAAIPAILYYFCLYMNVHYEACRTGLKGLPPEEVPKMKKVFADGWVYIIPIVALIAILVLGYSPARAAYVSIALLIAASLVRASTRMKLIDVWNALRDAGMTAFAVVAACACAGMIVGSVSMTGLGIKFSNVIGTLAGDKEILALLLTMFASLILGMALPTTANYIVQASIAAPALVALGIPVLTAHLFVFYFGVFADITPPVALAAYATAGIAQANPMTSGFIASRNVIVAFLVPYLFVYYPALLGKAPAVDVLVVTVASLFGIVALSAAFSGYFQRRCHPLERLLLLVSAGMLLYPEYFTSFLGLVILAVLYVWQGLKNKKAVPEEVAEKS